MPRATGVIDHERDHVQMATLELANACVMVTTRVNNATLNVKLIFNFSFFKHFYPLACERAQTAEQGCSSDSSYLFKSCKDMNRKPARETNGYFAHGTSCGAVLCSKTFFGFSWKAKTAKVVCECKEGACSWSKPLHKCPTGLLISQKNF